MSGSISRRRRTIGLTVGGALLLATVPAAGAEAIAPPHSARHAQTAGSTVSPPTGAPSVAADPVRIPSVCTVTSASPTKIVLGATAVKKTFSVTVAGCTLDQWAVGVFAFQDDDPDSTVGIASSQTPTISLSPRVLTNADAGKKTRGIAAASGREDPSDTADLSVIPATKNLTFQLLRKATFGSTFDATPEPVQKGAKIRLKGTLKRVNWNGAKNLKFNGFAKAKVKVQFKAHGATGYTTVKTVMSGAGGMVSTTVPASKTGRWRLVFAGISTTSSAISGSDVIKVNR